MPGLDLSATLLSAEREFARSRRELTDSPHEEVLAGTNLLSRLERAAPRLSAARALLAARDSAWTTIEGLHVELCETLRAARLTEDDCVRRLLALQAYMVTTWSVCDVIADVSASILCPFGGDFARSNESRSLGLLAMIAGPVKDGGDSNKSRKGKDRGRADAEPRKRRNTRLIGTASVPLVSVLYGYSVAQSYALRNVLAHDPLEMMSMFSDVDSNRPFLLSTEFVANLKHRCNDYGVDLRNTRRDPAWPDKLDALHAIRDIHRELDQALAILVESSAATAAHLSAVLVPG